MHYAHRSDGILQYKTFLVVPSTESVNVFLFQIRRIILQLAEFNENLNKET